ncbi:ATP-binding cassette domain-containing protein [Nocardia sp. NPDC019395]|uniref:ABC transporter ATP-binding protein n=1 Tax=Nocardia sp. NPDC019395 TaxID=3154686 RepID=UPI0033FF2CCF
MKPFSAAPRPERHTAEAAASPAAGNSRRTPVFELDAVSLRRGSVTVLDSVGAEIPAGACTVITGRSGAGKSSLLRLLNRLDEPDAGRITFSGNALEHHDVLDLRRRVQLVAQHPILLTDTVFGDLCCACPTLSREAGAALLQRAGLAPVFCDRPTAGLSGGEAARVCLARALAMGPQVLLLDEPTAALDPVATRAIEYTLGGFTAAGGTVVLVGHDPAQIRRLADRVITLDHGRIAEPGARS